MTGTLRNVAVLLDASAHPFELGVACEVFGRDRSAAGLPCFDFAVCGVGGVDGAGEVRGAGEGSGVSGVADPGSSPAPGPAPAVPPVPLTGGLWAQPSHGLERTYDADLLVIPAWDTDGCPPPPAVVDALHAAVDRGATILSVCSGAFLLAAAGLLRGRRATCHWLHADQLRARYPDVTVDPDRLYIPDGPLVTSAGTAAGIDACLYLLRRDLGARAANAIARRMVVPPHRDGSQAQYVETPVPPRSGGDDLTPLLDWLQRNLHLPHRVGDLAARVHLSPRTFARRFSATTGTTPHHWLTRQRVLLAQRLLEEDAWDVDEVARRSGFGNAETLRHHFARQLHTTPTAYRRTFSHQLTPEGRDLAVEGGN